MAEFTLGSISTGTLRTQDLIPAFLSALVELGGEIPLGLKYDDGLDEDPYWTSDDAAFDMSALTDALQELCPPFVCFGAHEGDGADFGFWPDRDALEEALAEEESRGTVNNPDNGGEELTLSDYGVIVHVNDHGNVTVMDLERNVLWSTV